MNGLGGEQRPVGFGGLVEQVEDAMGLLGAEPDGGRLLQKLEGPLMRGLGHELIQRGALQLRRRLDRLPGAGGNTCDEAGFAFSQGGHGANMAPPARLPSTTPARTGRPN